jgi:hypothetical protein
MAASAHLTGGFVNNQIDPSRLSPIARTSPLLPVDQADHAARCDGIPQTTRTPGVDQVDYTLNNQQSIFGRHSTRSTTTGHLRRQERADAQPHGSEQPGPLIVVGHNFVLSSFVNALRVTYNKTLNDRPLPEFFTATDLGSKVYSPLPDTWASASPATASRSAMAAPIPVTST